MRKSLSILHTADSHIGAGLPARPRHAWPRRGDDFITSFRRVIGRAFERNVDLVIHAGDVFDRSQPSARALTTAAEPLLELAVKGIPVVIVPGNHERSTIPTTLLFAHPNIYIAASPRTFSFNLRGTRVAISAFPCLRRDAAKAFPRALEATEWSSVQADLRILVVHQTFESATCGPANFRFRSGDDVVERWAVPEAFDYVAAGHVHRHQALPKVDGMGPPIVYAGSPDRVSFAEASEPKGCVLIEGNDSDLALTFLKHDVRPMSIWPVDVTGLTRGQIRGEVERILESLPPQAVTQVRMSGCSTVGSLRSLGFTVLAREARPDVLLTVSTQAVECVSSYAAPHRKAPVRSVFAQLHAPHEEVVRASTRDVKRLPTGRGVYAMYDAGGRVLYIGKSNSIRTRVRAHVRGATGANFFRGWSRQIAEIEVRRASSDLEALLIEAELIRQLRPPFNRQMRRWRDYRYLCENGKPHQQLEVCARPCPGDHCFGPFRSRHLAESVSKAITEHFQLALCPQNVSDTGRYIPLMDMRAALLCSRYYQNLCCGPCAGRATKVDYGGRVAGRDALLRGEDDSVVHDLERQVASATRPGCLDDGSQHLRRRAVTMRLAFDQAKTLREAERLVNGLLLMPGADGCRTAATLTRKGVRLDMLRNDPDAARRILLWHRRLTRRTGSNGIQRLPTAIMNSLCVAVRQFRRAPDQYQFIPPLELARLHERSLLATAFGPDKKSHAL